MWKEVQNRATYNKKNNKKLLYNLNVSSTQVISQLNTSSSKNEGASQSNNMFTCVGGKPQLIAKMVAKNFWLFHVGVNTILHRPSVFAYLCTSCTHESFPIKCIRFHFFHFTPGLTGCGHRPREGMLCYCYSLALHNLYCTAFSHNAARFSKPHSLASGTVQP